MRIIEVAKDALRLTWQRKYLWVFGILAAVGGGGGGGTGPRTKGAAPHIAEALPGWLIPVIVAACVLAIAFVVLHVVGEAALIASVRHEREGDRSSVRGGFREGATHFWTVLGLKVAFAGVMLATVAVVVAPVLLAVAKWIPIWAGIAIVLVLVLPSIPWLLSVYFAYQYALRFAVLDGERFRPSVRRAWQFLHGRLADSLQLFAVMLVGRMGAGALMFVALVPGAVVGLLAYAATGLIPALIIGGVVALPFAVTAMGAGRVFDSSLWTIGFLESRREVA